jgi:hypothetical protein
MKSKPILRVGLLNNFNHTKKEIEQCNNLVAKGYKVFVNSNAKTPISYGPCITTLNPDLDSFINPTGDISKISAARIKVLASPNTEVRRAVKESLLFCIANDIPALLTIMRFPSKDLMCKYVNDTSKYHHKNGYFRTTWQEVDKEIPKLPISPPIINYCDRSGNGCPSCHNCSKLTFNEKSVVAGINLSSSGVCPHNCPGCFSKRVLMGRSPALDKITINRKQKGELKH